MKTTKRILGILLALLTAFSFAMGASAEATGEGTPPPDPDVFVVPMNSSVVTGKTWALEVKTKEGLGKTIESCVWKQKKGSIIVSWIELSDEHSLSPDGTAITFAKKTRQEFPLLKSAIKRTYRVEVLYTDGTRDTINDVKLAFCLKAGDAWLAIFGAFPACIRATKKEDEGSALVGTLLLVFFPLQLIVFPIFALAALSNASAAKKNKPVF